MQGPGESPALFYAYGELGRPFWLEVNGRLADTGPVETEYTGKGRMGSRCSDLNVSPPKSCVGNLISDTGMPEGGTFWEVLTVLRALPSLVD